MLIYQATAVVQQVATGLLVPAQDRPPPGQLPEWGNAAPVGLAIVLVLLLATVLLVRNMSKRITRLPESFEDSGPAAAGPGTGAPDAAVPGSEMSGTTVPESTVPGSSVPGSSVPGSSVPESTAPGAGAAGTAPGSVAADSAAPRTAAPGDGAGTGSGSARS
ncbi:hypothetical protein [Pseudonocardia sp. HH130630-07]|uniref:hypothetical protein n=1 Tax=Pseudonocardia sp. HH130630-07 TaxID=1690815 RepID=UPI000814FC0B|nr:hypothetical protein [Pseudonocardia sp. HH130630-07]ANY06046.1 hypothetical protein AFB00_06700 [Pseudonocardia sp. HH130630-07]